MVAATWAVSNSYSWSHNSISDLGNTHCGLYGSRLVCSPLYGVMNGSFILLGITMMAGVVVLRRQFCPSRLASFGFASLALAGLGTMLVGLFPENSVSGWHLSGAALSFVFGNLGLIILGLSLRCLPVLARSYTVLSGVVGLGALGLFMAGLYLGLGNGGMERLAGYPQTIWLIVFGVYLLLNGIPASNDNRSPATGA
jgi:hypothetical membrane protein